MPVPLFHGGGWVVSGAGLSAGWPVGLIRFVIRGGFGLGFGGAALGHAQNVQVRVQCALYLGGLNRTHLLPQPIEHSILCHGNACPMKSSVEPSGPGPPSGQATGTGGGKTRAPRPVCNAGTGRQQKDKGPVTFERTWEELTSAIDVG